jgi:hypothetical protein
VRGRALPAAAILAAVLTVATACTSPANAEDLQVGDCLKVGVTVDKPEATKVACGSKDSNFKIIGKAASSDQCPTDADSSYSQHRAFGSSGSTVCLDIDWEVGACMSVDPAGGSDPVRVDCNDTSASNRQRATQILTGVANADQCASGQGYACDQRQFTVCVEDAA